MSRKKLVSGILLSFAAVFLLCGCGTDAKRLEISDPGALTTISQVDPIDWATVAEKSIKSLLASGALIRKDGQPSIVMISRVRNFTTLHLESTILTSKMRQAILISGQAKCSSAVGVGAAIDPSVRRIRAKEYDEMFNQSTVPKNGTVVAPNMSLSGAIIQQTAYQGRKEESYFFFHIVLTDLTTGIAVWEDNVDILKQGTHPLFSF